MMALSPAWLDAQQTERWGKALAIVLALHGVVLAAAILWQGVAVTPPPEMTVSLDLAPIPEPVEPPAAAPAAAPAPQPVAQPVPKPVIPPPPVVEPDVPLPVIAPPAPKLVRAPVPAAPPASAAPSPDGVAGGTGTGAADSDGRAAAGPPRGRRGGGDTAAGWHGRVMAHLDRHKKYPPAAKMMKREGRVHIHLMVDRNGEVLAVSVARGAGFKAFDDEAVAVVKRAQPLPPPPSELEGDRIPVNMSINFSLQGPA